MEKGSIEWLLANQDFINWVKRPNRESNYYWKKWLEENPEKTEDLKAASEIINQFKFKEPNIENESDGFINSGFERVLSDIYKEKKSDTLTSLNSSSNSVKILKVSLSIAAALSFLVMLSFLLFNRNEVSLAEVPDVVIKKTQFGQKLRITLPDHSLVVLNSGSQLKYYQDFNSKSREVYLIGEAFFNVQKNASLPFHVNTSALQVEALGTSFSVSAFEEDRIQDVALEEGQVRVSQKNAQIAAAEILQPGEMIKYDLGKETMVKSKFDLSKMFAWKDGILIFDEATLDDFKSKIEKWYGVDVDISGDQNTDLKITGYFENETLENVLKSLEYSTGAKFIIKENNVKLNLKNEDKQIE